MIGSEIEKQINIFSGYVFNKLAHIFLKNDLLWFFERLKREKALYHIKKLDQQIPPLVFVGLVLAEDRRFYEHRGIDIRAILRAIIHYLQYGIVEGGSTIEQQLTRLLTNRYEKNIQRKIRELLLSSCINEILLEKKDVLGVYLNLANFGSNIRGIEQICHELNYSFDQLIRPPEVSEVIARIKYPQPLSVSVNSSWIKKLKKRKTYIAIALEENQLIGKFGKNYLNCLPKSKINELLVDRYPTPKNILEAVKDMEAKEKEYFLRSFMSEGIPFVFSKMPLYYENIRQLIAETLEINPRDILIIGSSRLGYSLKPNKYGQLVDKNSDIDFNIVSFNLFKKLEKCFLQWGKEYRYLYKKLKLSKKEKNSWENNIKNIPFSIRKGFINPIEIPNCYPLLKNIESLRIEMTNDIEEFCNDMPKTISLRIYKDWLSFFKQNILTLDYLLKDIKK